MKNKETDRLNTRTAISILALTMSTSTVMAIPNTWAQTSISTAQPTVQRVEIQRMSSGYQLNIYLSHASNVTSINVGTQNPFGGMPHSIVRPSSVKKQLHGVWTASLGTQIPTTLTIYRRLWIMPTTSSGQGQNERWENGDFKLQYKVALGDSLYKIARLFNLPLSTEIGANPQIQNPRMIYPNTDVTIKRIMPIPPMYQVKKGDSLYIIAHAYGLSLSRVIKDNPQIKNPNLIQIGQTINLPQNFY